MKSCSHSAHLCNAPTVVNIASYTWVSNGTDECISHVCESGM
jgi:hypothetical protein